MTSKEKAKELLWKYLPILESWKKNNSNDAKQCALIAVDEIINVAPNDKSIFGTDYLTVKEYWKEVKKEIENL